MATTVTVTGSGTPIHGTRAGPGVLVRHESLALQFDVGTGTRLRLAEVGFDLRTLSAAFITHHHSDHLMGLADLLVTRWLEDNDRVGLGALPVIVPDGMAADIAEHVLDVWRDEITLRAAHTAKPDRPDPEVRRFTASTSPGEVYAADGVTVAAVAVRHHPVVPAVAYRVTTPRGIIVVSGDTSVCPEVESLATGADVVVHEAFRRGAAAGTVSDPAALAAYHADTIELGAMAARAGVGTLVLTHCIPPPDTEADEREFVEEVRTGGFGGRVVVASDLTAVEL